MRIDSEKMESNLALGEYKTFKLFYLCTHHNDSPYKEIFFAVDHDRNNDLSQLLGGLPDSDSSTNGSLAADSLFSSSLDADSPPWHPMEYIEDVWSPQGVSASESQSDLLPLPSLPPDSSEINTTTPSPGPCMARSTGLNRSSVPPVPPGVARRPTQFILLDSQQRSLPNKC